MRTFVAHYTVAPFRGTDAHTRVGLLFAPTVSVQKAFEHETVSPDSFLCESLLIVANCMLFIRYLYGCFCRIGYLGTKNYTVKEAELKSQVKELRKLKRETEAEYYNLEFNKSKNDIKKHGKILLM